MSDSIQLKNNIFNNKNNVFNNFSTRSKAHNYLSYDPARIKQDNKAKSRSKTKTILSVAGSTVLAGGVLLMFSGGAQKFVSKNVGKLKDYLESRKDTLSIASPNKSTKYYEYAIRGLNKFLKKAESINNITSLKDILFMRMMYETEPTRLLHQYISKSFENLSLKTVRSSYKKTGKLFDDLYGKFDRLDTYIMKDSPDEIIKHKGKEYTRKELVTMAKGLRDEIKTTVSAFIAPNSQEARHQEIKKYNSKLYSTFWDASFKDFWSKKNKFKNKEMWQTFIAEEQMKGDKTHIAELAAPAREIISYGIDYKVSIIKGLVENLSDFVPLSDVKGREQIRKLEWFIKNPKAIKNNRELLLKELTKLEKQKLTSDIPKNIADKIQENRKNYIGLIKDTVKENKKGATQEMLSIYNSLAPYELEKSGTLAATKKTIKSFDKSVNLELGDFFDKVRDLELGSAPTDILTIAVSTGLIMRSLQYANNDDKKKSVMLKSGIPLIGGIATSLISATKLVSGGKSLALGFASGIALNQMGILADKYRHKIEKKKNIKRG